MITERNAQDAKPKLGFKIFNRYVRFFHNKIYYRKVYSVDAENIPQNCPLLIVSNHQNSLCDPLALLTSIRTRRERKIRVITRADVFQKPFANKVLRWLGLLPAYRLSIDGENFLTNNTDTFEESEEELLNNGTVIIFPESRHQDKRWLGPFSSGYLHILFKAAEKCNFEKELFVLPSCNHYSNYFDIQGEMVIKYGTPVSIAPYYELYKTKPRTAQRQVNAIVRQQVSDLMLNVTDLDNYHAVDYLRNTYGIKFAKEKGFNPDKLPEKLLADKQLFARLEELKSNDKNSVQSVYNDVLVLDEKTKHLKINDRDFDNKSTLWKIISKSLLFALFLPLFAFSLIPNILILCVPGYVTSRVKDPMMHSAVNIILSLLFTIPLSYIVLFSLVWAFSNSLLTAAIYLVCLPFLAVFVWHYYKAWRSWKDQLRFYKLLRSGKLDEVIILRNRIHDTLNNLLGIRDNPLVYNLYAYNLNRESNSVKQARVNRVTYR